MMNSEEERRCPLCTEEMDWTDQQFMPCKCGYQVCVWCFHHIMDMTEKDETEGRCPACRTIYEKEKVVAMKANCGRTRTKTTSRKAKPPKAKPKATEVKKDLTNVRVIQRKMAYVIGLPLSLADEDVLQRKEYFGQYGKVTKVSLSRTAGGTIQQFINDTCSVYITYSKEEEALRCIQSVHGFVLEGKLLRASFGTAKYCHAWLKSMPCNNPSCLYLHGIGAEEDSFGKDEVAAVHTRNRVERIVGSANNMTKRSGNVLPPPADVYNITSTFSNKSTLRSGIFDAAHGSVNSNCDITCAIRSKDTDGINAVPHKLTTFVDIIGKSNISASEKDENDSEDGRILNLCSELSSGETNKDTCSGEPFSVPRPCKISSADKYGASLAKITKDEPPLREYTLSSDKQGSKDTYGSSLGEFTVHPSYSAYRLEDSSIPSLDDHSPNGLTLDPYPTYNSEDEASLPVECVNFVLNETSQEMEFHSSAKHDRIHKSSLSFSNKEIVGHLHRIDDDSLVNYEENSVLAAVESSIISNIMSIDFDSCEDSLRMPHGLSELLDDTDGLGGSSWSSLNSDQSGYSTGKQDALVGQMVGSPLPEYGDNKELYQSKSQHPVSRAQSSTPPGFSLRSRCPPPGFSTTERTGYLPRSTSVSCLANTSLYPSTLSQPPSARTNSSIHNADFFDPHPVTSFKHLCSETGQITAAKVSSFEEELNLWRRMQQSPSAHQDSKFSPTFVPHTPSHELSYSTHGGITLSGLDDMHGLTSQLVDEYQAHDPSFFRQISQQKPANMHSSITNNGYRQDLDEFQHKGNARAIELEKKERVGGANRYFHGYGDLMFNSGDVYTRVFGL